MRRIGWIAIVMMTGGLLWAAEAKKTEEPGRLQLKTSRVVVFKDGHGLFVKGAVGKTGPAGTVFTEEVPDAAVLGSFWITNKENDVDAVVASRIKKETREKLTESCQSIFEIIKANQGREVFILRNDKVPLEGKIWRLLEGSRSAASTRAPVAIRPWSSFPAHLRRQKSSISNLASPPKPAPEVKILSPSGQYFILRTEVGDVLVACNDVKSLRIKDMVTEIEREKITTEKLKRLTVRFRRPKPDQARNLNLFYFRPGIRWIPTYRIGLLKEKMVEIAMQAEVLNQAEDFVDTPVDFVVGMPTFRFKNVVSPLSLERVLRHALREAAPQLMGQLAARNVYYQQRAGERHRPRPGGAEPEGIAEIEKAMSGAEVQDLFYYSTQKLSLKYGERAAVGVFRAKVPYRDVYTWDFRLARQGASAQSTAASPLQIRENQVWHQIVLSNTTTVPWTTGAAMILDHGRPVGQDLLTFTPPKRTVMVPVTAAVSVRGTFAEKEVHRQRHATKFHGHSYARITNRATFRVVNSLKEKVHLVLTCHLGGKCTETTDEGRVVVTGYQSTDWTNFYGNPRINPHSSVVWEVDVEAGQTKELACTYRFFLRD